MQGVVMYSIPQFVNKPMKYIGLETDEMSIIYGAVALSIFTQSRWVFFILLVISVFLIRKKRKCPPGFLKHLLFFMSLYKVAPYPEYSKQIFLE
jgi:hypothetical protein